MVVFSSAAFHARVRGSFPNLGGLKETNLFLPHPLIKISIVWSFREREVACSNFDIPLSREQCQRIQLTFLKRLYRLSLAYLCTKVA